MVQAHLFVPQDFASHRLETVSLLVAKRGGEKPVAGAQRRGHVGRSFGGTPNKVAVGDLSVSIWPDGLQHTLRPTAATEHQSRPFIVHRRDDAIFRRTLG